MLNPGANSELRRRYADLGERGILAVQSEEERI